ncbi:MAG TPA: hypothetical protein VK126_01550 [Nitrososphaerales archaeon]|nr:hypothetical protein [Nitrososphaerales archaeon]
MKARMLLDGGTPKVPPAELRKMIQKAGIEVTESEADFGVVVGGDGKFGRYGRTENIPLLFVGVRSRGATGSKAYLAQTTLEELPRDLERIRGGDYKVDSYRRLEVLKNGRSLGEVFTDVYLQRGSESTCIRYKVRVTGGGVDIDEAAIGDGVVVTTRAGSTGYYSYPDRIKEEWIDPSGFSTVGRNSVGICHITPTYTERAGSELPPLRYTVPWGSLIELSLFRRADARLYGTTDRRTGVRMFLGDKLTIVPGKRVTKVIFLRRKVRSR